MYRWDLGKFGDCSSSCGGGTKTRTVHCIQEYAQGSKPLNLPGRKTFSDTESNEPFYTYTKSAADNFENSPAKYGKSL